MGQTVCNKKEWQIVNLNRYYRYSSRNFPVLRRSVDEEAF